MLKPPTFFSDPYRRANKALGKVARGSLPIRGVVEWSKTARGGKQYDMFPDYAREGCMRWGMCDTGGAE